MGNFNLEEFLKLVEQDILENEQISKSAKPITKKEQNGFKDDVYVLKVWVTDRQLHVRNMPRRDILIKGNSNLDKLAYCILSSFQFDRDHMYLFSDNLKTPFRATETYFIDDYPSTNEIVVAQVFTELKKKMMFVFDFGHEWRFIVQFIQKRLVEKGEKNFPVITNIVGESPQQYPDYDEEDDYEDEDME